MTKETVEKSALWPWLDKGEEEKFVKGVPGQSSDYWIEKPNLAPCWKGAERVWKIESANYQQQCWCPVWKCFINPSGFACELCRKQTWPNSEHWKAHLLPKLVEEHGKSAAEDALVSAVEYGQLTETEARELADEFFAE